MIRADDATINDARRVAGRPRATEGTAAVHASVAEHGGVAVLIAESDQIHSEDLDLCGHVRAEVLAAYDRIPEIDIHGIAVSSGLRRIHTAACAKATDTPTGPQFVVLPTGPQCDYMIDCITN